jgi:hypothetical protein
MPIDIIKPFLDLFDKAAPTAANGILRPAPTPAPAVSLS